MVSYQRSCLLTVYQLSKKLNARHLQSAIWFLATWRNNEINQLWLCGCRITDLIATLGNNHKDYRILSIPTEPQPFQLFIITLKNLEKCLFFFIFARMCTLSKLLITLSWLSKKCLMGFINGTILHYIQTRPWGLMLHQKKIMRFVAVASVIYHS